MKKIKYLLSALILVLTGCQGMENPSTSEGDSSSTEQNSEVESSDTSMSSESSESVDEGPLEDPYVGMSEAEFYRDYKPSTSYRDTQYRTQHYFMSGALEKQKQRPTIADNQPMENGKYVKNISSGLSSDGLSYDIVDSQGNVVNTIFKGGAYITLEEVAAYVFAFGEIPANYVSSNSMKPTQSEWGVYLRLNHNPYSNDTDRYPYEPELPDGSLKQYYELDIGTTGTFEYGGGYRPAPYNNGSKIVRGGSRIVYTRFYKGSGKVELPSEMKLFYTFDHYRDFQEYLNYEGGWGKWFGNIAGGASDFDETGKKKTSYPSIVHREF